MPTATTEADATVVQRTLLLSLLMVVAMMMMMICVKKSEKDMPFNKRTNKNEWNEAKWILFPFFSTTVQLVKSNDLVMENLPSTSSSSTVNYCK